MDYVKLGHTGLDVSRICLGCMTFGEPGRGPHSWTLDAEKSRPIIQKALELGINFFDTANVYSDGTSEEIVGRALKDLTARQNVVIATKVHGRMHPGPNGTGLSRRAILAEIDNSLRRLGVDYVDLYQIHRWDPHTPIAETMEALHEVVKAGKARYVGASSMWAWQFAEAQQVAKQNGWTRFVTMQNHYNLAYREEEREMIPLCRHQGVALIPWSPLARGFLAGNRKATDKTEGATTRAKTDEWAQQLYYEDHDFAVVDAVSALAKDRGVSNARIAYAWLLAKGVTAPIVGASKDWQIDEAVAATEFELTGEEITKLEAPYRPHRVAGHS